MPILDLIGITEGVGILMACSFVAGVCAYVLICK